MKVSAVVTAYNVAPWIAGAISSLHAQERLPDEIIVVDDGSTDGTDEILSSIDGIHVITQSNRGASAARNAGARVSTGDIIVFLDADDRFLPPAVGSFERVLTDNSRAGAVVANHLWVDADGRQEVGWPELITVTELGRKDLLKLLLGNYLVTDAAFRREVWERHPFREDLRTSEDLALWIDLLSHDVRVVMLPEVLAHCRVKRAGALTSSLKVMREDRSRLYRGLSRRSDLTWRERTRAHWMGTRAAVGAWMAR